MYNANNYGYNPYGTYIPQRQVQQPVEQNMQQPFNTIQRSSMLNGKTVDSIDVVKSMDIPLDGSISYFPTADGSAIVTKQLNLDGTSKITIFKPIQEQKEEIRYITREDMENALNDLNNEEIQDIKDELKDIKQELKDLRKKKKDE